MFFESPQRHSATRTPSRISLPSPSRIDTAPRTYRGPSRCTDTRALRAGAAASGSPPSRRRYCNARHKDAPAPKAGVARKRTAREQLASVPRMSQRPTPAQIPRLLAGRRGYLGWWVVGAVVLVAFSRVAFFNPILGIFIDPLQDEFGWSRTEIAGALSIGTLVGAFSSPLLGRFVDRYGGRRFMVVGVLTIGVLLLLLALIDALWQFYILFGLGRAIVTGVIEIAIAVTVANWFIRNRGRATGLMMVGTRGGMVIMPLIVLLFLSLADWRAAFAALGLLILLFTVLPPFLFVRRRPEDLGLAPDGDPPLPATGARSRRRSASASDPQWSVRQAVRTRAFWLLLFGTSQLFFAGGATNLALVSHLEDNGLSQTSAITVVTVWAAVGIVGGVIGGELRERIGVRFALPLVMLGSAAGVTWLIFVDQPWMAYVFAAWQGLWFGAILPLNQIAFADYFGRWSIGAIRGVTAPVQFGLNALGPIASGLVFDARGSYDLIFAVFAGLLLFGGALVALAGRPPDPPPPPAADFGPGA